MRIRVWRRDDLYDVLVTGAPGRTRPCRSGEPLNAVEVVTFLEELGCHPNDVGAAMFDADPLWMERLAGQLDLVELHSARLTAGWRESAARQPIAASTSVPPRTPGQASTGNT